MNTAKKSVAPKSVKTKTATTPKKDSKVVSKAAVKTPVATPKKLSTLQRAPSFSLPSTDGASVSLASLSGERFVLYFYPKDMTPGCTVEAHEFSALAAQFQKKGIRVFGISPDSIDSHKKFIAKESITFPLLSDVGHVVSEKFGVWVEKSMYGKKYMGIERTTFVVDKEGKIEHVYHKVKPDGHAVCVLEDMSKK
jgi:peroxiredoxin Q/BCP